MVEVNKIAENNKKCSIFHYYVRNDLLVICMKNKKFIFSFEDYKDEKAIIKLIDEAIKTINKKCFLQLEMKAEKKINLNVNLFGYKL